MLDMSQFTGAFTKDAHEMMAKARASLDALETDLSSQSQLYDVMRIFHSVKSTSQIMGKTDIADRCGGMEKLFNDFLESKSPATPDAIAQGRGVVGFVEKALDK